MYYGQILKLIKIYGKKIRGCLCYTVGYKWVTVMNRVEFEFNDNIYIKTYRHMI